MSKDKGEQCWQFETSLQNEPNSLQWNYQIAIPQTVADEITKEQRRVICQLNELTGFHAALMHDGEGGYFITINSAIRKKLKGQEKEPLSVQIWLDKSKYGTYLAPEMEALLESDKEGSHFFHQLTIGKQRTLLHIIGKPKSSATRLKKAVIVLDFLKTNQGVLDFKMLNEAFKAANRR